MALDCLKGRVQKAGDVSAIVPQRAEAEIEPGLLRFP
jgi:hypothetical protein